jgi:hypothetical protein
MEGRNPFFYTNPRVCLAPLWLDTLLVAHGLPAALRITGHGIGRVFLPGRLQPEL